MAKREHWTKRLKRENKELKTENADLKRENTELKGAVAPPITPTAYFTIIDTGKTAEPPERRHREPERDKYEMVYVSRRGADSNWAAVNEYFAIEGSDKVYRFKEYEGDEIDIFVMDDNDRYNAVFSGGEEYQGGWSSVKEGVQQDWLEDELVGVPIRTIFDPHGFFDELPDVQAQEIIRGRLQNIGSDMFDEQPEIYKHDSMWRFVIHDIDDMVVMGESFGEALAACKSDLEKAQVMKRFKNAIRVMYIDGKLHPEEHSIKTFQLVGKGWKTLQVTIVADRGQEVIVSLGDVIPKSLQVDKFMAYENDFQFSGTDPEGGQIRFE